MRKIDADELKKVLSEYVPLKHYLGRSVSKALKNLAHIKEVVDGMPTIEDNPVADAEFRYQTGNQLIIGLDSVDFSRADLARSRYITFVNNDTEELDKMFRIVDMDADVEEVKHAQWICGELFEPPTCSACLKRPKTPGYCGTEKFYYTEFARCPHCGARMDARDPAKMEE